MSLVVVGGSGQLGRALRITRPDAVFLERDALDLRWDEPRIRAALDGASADASGVIIAAAWTDVDGAESDPHAALQTNARAPGMIARWCADQSVPVVYPSTDYVFDGSGDAPWTPACIPAPLGAYGASKLAGERAVMGSGARATVMRTSWVYDGVGPNFPLTMRRLARERPRLAVVSDQIGRPTHAGDLARACLLAVEAGQSSAVHHYSGGGDFASWADFARAVLDSSGLDAVVEDVPSSDYPTKAQRPRNSRLDISSFTQAFGETPPDWRARVSETVKGMTS